MDRGEAVTVDEDRMHLRTRLEELVGVSGAKILMDRPPGGWSDLVTNRTPDLRVAAVKRWRGMRSTGPSPGARAVHAETSRPYPNVPSNFPSRTGWSGARRRRRPPPFEVVPSNTARYSANTYHSVATRPRTVMSW